MSVDQIIGQWYERGKPLKVPGANTRIWREYPADGKLRNDGYPVVCLHGVPASAYLYRKMLPELAGQGLEAIALDLPGLGFADRPRKFDYSWTGLAKWFVKALDAAGIHRFHLVVHDIGGPIGFEAIRRITAHSPARVRSLAVLNTIAHPARFHRPWPMAPLAIPGLGWLWLQGMRTPVFLWLMHGMGVHLRPKKEELLAYRKLLLLNDGGRAFLKIMRGFECNREFEDRTLGALANRSFPAQIIWGADDPTLSVEKHVKYFLDILGLEQWHSIHGKHFLQEDSPHEISVRIAHLARHETAE